MLAPRDGEFYPDKYGGIRYYDDPTTTYFYEPPTTVTPALVTTTTKPPVIGTPLMPVSNSTVPVNNVVSSGVVLYSAYDDESDASDYDVFSDHSSNGVTVTSAPVGNSVPIDGATNQLPSVSALTNKNFILGIVVILFAFKLLK